MKKLSLKTFPSILLLAFVLASCSPGGTGGSASTGNNSGSSSSSYGIVPLPTDTVDLQAGQTYQVGQAIKDSQTGVIFVVTGVRMDDSLAGLDAGETYALVDITLGNAGSETYSSSSAGSYVVRVQGSDKTYGQAHLTALLGANVLTSDNQLDVDVAPGTAFHGLLPAAVPATATGLTLQFTPVGSTSMGQSFTVDLGF